MTPIPLRRELLLSFAVLFVAALGIAVLGLLLLLPLVGLLTSPAQATLYIMILLVADLAVLFWFGHRLLVERFVKPMEALTSPRPTGARASSPRIPCWRRAR